MSFHPLSNNVLVKVSDRKTTTKSGLFIPDTAQEKSPFGEVVAIGPGKMSEQGALMTIVGVEVGDTVMYGKYSGSEISVDGVMHLVMSADDLSGIIRD